MVYFHYLCTRKTLKQSVRPWLAAAERDRLGAATVYYL